ncbi:hypothetical protein V502_09963, partial [Pseudogymnoascus sp. VKM F-4520 (FW-2644)]
MAAQLRSYHPDRASRSGEKGGGAVTALELSPRWSCHRHVHRHRHHPAVAVAADSHHLTPSPPRASAPPTTHNTQTKAPTTPNAVAESHVAVIPCTTLSSE